MCQASECCRRRLRAGSLTSEFNLYSLSVPEIPQDPEFSDIATALGVRPLPELSPSSRSYAENAVSLGNQVTDCSDPILDFRRWEGFPVRECAYSGAGASARSVFRNANRPQLAQWVVTGCHDAETTDMLGCIDWLAGHTRMAASGNVFPVSGFVPENLGTPICYFFP